MARKSKQHIVPRVHLRAFVDPVPPASHPAGVEFTPGVWLVDKELQSEPTRRAPANVFYERHAYTLRSDNPESPEIEEWLSWIEGEYAGVQRKLQALEELTAEDWGVVLLFVGVLHARTLKQVGHWQRQLAELERTTRMVERGHTGREVTSDVRFAGWDEIGLKTIQERAEGFARVVRDGSAYLLENRSDIPFMTSDTPVLTTHTFADVLVEWGVPKELVEDDTDEPQRRFVCFCPLTPKFALFASHLFSPSGELHWWSTNDPTLILSLMFQHYANSDAMLVANSSAPLPAAVQRSFRAGLELTRQAQAISSYVLLTTPSKQYHLSVERVETEDDGLASTLRFRVDDLELLRLAADCDQFVDVHYRDEATGSGGFFKKASFSSVAIVPDADSVLDQRI